MGLFDIVGDLVGGLFGMANQRSQIREQNFLAGGGEVQSMAANLRAAGLNPAGMMGSFSPPSSSISGNPMGDAITKMGSDIQSSVNDYMDGRQKTLQLQNDLLKAQIQSAKAGVVTQQLRNSQMATRYGAPGAVPTVRVVKPDGSAAHPYPAFSYYDMGNGHTIRLLSREAAGTQFGPTALVTGPELMPGLAIHQLDDTSHYLLRPDTFRRIQNFEPPLYQPGG